MIQWFSTQLTELPPRTAVAAQETDPVRKAGRLRRHLKPFQLLGDSGATDCMRRRRWFAHHWRAGVARCDNGKRSGVIRRGGMSEPFLDTVVGPRLACCDSGSRRATGVVPGPRARAPDNRAPLASGGTEPPPEWPAAKRHPGRCRGAAAAPPRAPGHLNKRPAGD